MREKERPEGTHAGASNDEAERELDRLASLIAKWVGLSMRLNRGNHGVKAMSDVGLTLPQIGALHVLMFEGPASVSSLQSRLELSLSATSHLVQRLVEAGLVRREEHPTDRRQKVVTLTQAGRRFVEEMLKARLKEFRASVEHLSPALRPELAAVLEKIVEDLAWKSAESVQCAESAESAESLAPESKEDQAPEDT